MPERLSNLRKPIRTLEMATMYLFDSSLLRTALDLLVDEDTEVRQVAALFVRQVACDQQLPGIQVTMYICTSFIFLLLKAC